MNGPIDFLPPWIRHYPRRHLRADILAGVIVTVLVIPQSLAYALLAGLPPQVGLYVSIVPVIVYALLGSSMVQAVGPVAITAIMTFTVLSPLATPGTPGYVLLAAELSLVSGVFILAFGLLRLGFLSQLLSRPVVSGFISGSAVLIVVSQLKFLVGVPVTGTGTLHVLASLVESLSQTNSTTCAIGVLSLLLLQYCRRSEPRLLERSGASSTTSEFVGRLMPLGVVFSGTVVVSLWDLDIHQGVAVVGTVKEGLASFQFFLPDLPALRTLTIAGLVLAFIGMVQNITMAQALAIQRLERVDVNKELVGLGAANISAAFYGGMPVGGGVSRSAVNVAAGAQTPLSSVVAAMCMLLVVATGTHWFARLPLAVLAASITIAAVSMIDVKAFRLAWSYDRADGLALLGTALGVLMFGLELGIALGIGFSMATLLLRASTPHIAVVGRIPGTEHFRNVTRHQTETIAGVLFLRIDESLFFGNLNAVEQRLAAELASAGATRHVVLVMSAVNRVDATAAEVLGGINRDLKERGIELHLAEVKGPVHDRLRQSELWKNLSGRVHLSVNSAYEALADLAATAQSPVGPAFGAADGPDPP
jgi:SulP family sulfate permease